ncbi:uncharacterized protein KNAG_0H00460 [Huiozyma naganishii CBS 8797]|uniref:Uncharacterized protein n=1 Tax=Huiozyma naganishii (strain ATCC MYA-139 / BCRC 22969 / CBS 8797 / KCTC 17520 / NBRC 10181 / NCYC 3082 / Yp74L-3) TaxID=1071383 RepID=J7S1I7_HUIN7|nr:hypothetical protein KNAG_0H00460 [Kazachstania naganishii CBS 8797]CCK71462.1 hypothetical protein KNAG_0H00460 [Kazachstania naganishii CBS 8797]
MSTFTLSSMKTLSNLENKDTVSAVYNTQAPQYLSLMNVAEDEEDDMVVDLNSGSLQAVSVKTWVCMAEITEQLRKL